jgi:hypothetical protein
MILPDLALQAGGGSTLADPSPNSTSQPIQAPSRCRNAGGIATDATAALQSRSVTTTGATGRPFMQSDVNSLSRSTALRQLVSHCLRSMAHPVRQSGSLSLLNISLRLKGAEPKGPGVAVSSLNTRTALLTVCSQTVRIPLDVAAHPL